MKEAKLKYCPFCGGEASVHSAIYLGCSGYVVTCSGCGIETRLMDTEESAIWLWNKRVQDENREIR